MENLVLDSTCGNSFENVALEAKGMAADQNRNVQFDFNGILCIVSRQTNLQWLLRDYLNSWTMGWKQVGPDCLETYPADVQKELEEKTAIRKKEQEEREAEYAKKEKEEMELFQKSVEGIEMEFADKEAWDKGLEKNSDPYGGGVYKYAEGWAKLMQVEIAAGKSVKECAEETSFKMGFMGITRCMYGAAVSVLSHCFKYGEELRNWHNKKYKHEGEGVVNPALLTITT